MQCGINNFHGKFSLKFVLQIQSTYSLDENRSMSDELLITIRWFSLMWRMREKNRYTPSIAMNNDVLVRENWIRLIEILFQHVFLTFFCVFLGFFLFRKSTTKHKDLMRSWRSLIRRKPMSLETLPGGLSPRIG